LLESGKYLHSAASRKFTGVENIAFFQRILVPGWNFTGAWTLARVITFHRFKGVFTMLVGALITFLVVILILYLINLLPLDGRAKQIARVVVIILGVISLLKYIAVF
jgi:hypothetical protein